MNHDELTQAERIVWDVAIEPPVYQRLSGYGGLEWVCTRCLEHNMGFTAMSEPEAHNSYCPYRRAVEWRREMEARG